MKLKVEYEIVEREGEKERGRERKREREIACIVDEYVNVRTLNGWKSRR